MKHLSIIGLLLFACSCTKQYNMQRLMTIIDSLQIRYPAYTDILSVYEKDMGTHWLYVVDNSVGIIYDNDGNIVVTEIFHRNNKAVLFYASSLGQTTLDEETVLSVIKNGHCTHRILWYYAVCKSDRKELLVQAANDNVDFYEIPAIRDFPYYDKASTSNELIVDYLSVKENGASDTMDIFLIAKFYNRTSDQSFSLLPPGDFVFINGNDTAYCNIIGLPLMDRSVDDPLWTPDPELAGRYEISCTTELVNNETGQDKFQEWIQSSLLFLKKQQAASQTLRIIFPARLFNY